MQKQTIQYDSPIDALVAVAKRLSAYEERFSMSSEEFYDKYTKGSLEDSIEYVEWSNDYQHYLTIRRDLEKHLQNAAWYSGTVS